MEIIKSNDIYREFLWVAANNKLTPDNLIDAAAICLLSAAEMLAENDDRLSQDYATELIAGSYLSLVEARLAHKKVEVKSSKLTVVKGDKV